MKFLMCVSTSANTTGIMLQTYQGEASNTWATLDASGLAKSYGIGFLPPGSLVARTQGNSSSQPISNSNNTSSSPPSATPTAQPEKSTPIGAIFGGAVGGFAVLAGMIGSIVFLLLRHRRHNRSIKEPGASNKDGPVSDTISSKFSGPAYATDTGYDAKHEMPAPGLYTGSHGQYSSPTTILQDGPGTRAESRPLLHEAPSNPTAIAELETRT